MPKGLAKRVDQRPLQDPWTREPWACGPGGQAGAGGRFSVLMLLAFSASLCPGLWKKRRGPGSCVSMCLCSHRPAPHGGEEGWAVWFRQCQPILHPRQGRRERAPHSLEPDVGGSPQALSRAGLHLPKHRPAPPVRPAPAVTLHFYLRSTGGAASHGCTVGGGACSLRPMLTPSACSEGARGLAGAPRHWMDRSDGEHRQKGS